ncbi:hypothetical protein GQ53DRAFT_877250 [Thozetella sp. PMI_491]|nr:hypothetical protein GQ53DRAFT_877250 [Thozetella sp. PMI_491]
MAKLPAPFQVTPKYSWQSEQKDQRMSLQIQEEALENSIKIVQPLAHAIVREHEDFEVLIGVQGATGAGKTSLLNAVLGYRELLPTNSSEAATSTACQIGYNNDEDPEKAFRAEIKFRDKQNFKEELDEFFRDLSFRRKLRAGDSDDEYDHDNKDDKDRLAALREATENIQETYAKLHAIWPDLSLAHLELMKTDDLLKPDHPGVAKLGTTSIMNSPNAEDFSARIKSFLDSSQTIIDDRGAMKVALWPFIKHVRVYVKAPVLKHGRVLVDLPGLSDATESRTTLARSFYDKLAITLIVTPAVRAADEQTARGLMDENQELRLRMNDQCDGRSFGVVLSKTDDFEWEIFASQEHLREQLASMKELKQLRVRVVDSQKRLKTLKREHTWLLKTYKPLKSRSRKSKDPDSRREAKLVRKKIRDTFDQKRMIRKNLATWKRELNQLEGAIIHACQQMRAKKLCTRILNQLIDSQEAFGLGGSGAAKPIKVMPVSAIAFWAAADSADSAEGPRLGFPSVAYSGIPMLRDWLDDVTSARRERHAMGLLIRLNALLAAIKTWLNTECEKNRVQLPRESLMAKRSGKQHAISVNKLDPLKATAILKRQGSFKSRTLGAIDWMDGMANEYKLQIARVWIENLHGDIPKLAESARKSMEDTYESFVEAVAENLLMEFPDHKQYLLNEVPSLRAIKDKAADAVFNAITDISTQARKIHTPFYEAVKEKWTPIFEKALKENGKGSLMRRQSILEKHAEDNGGKMYRGAIKDLHTELISLLGTVPDALEKIRQQARKDSLTQAELIISNIIQHRGGSVEEINRAKTHKAKLQEQLRDSVSNWNAVWISSNSDIKAVDPAESNIPDTYVPASIGDEDDEDTDIDDSGLSSETASDDDGEGEEIGKQQCDKIDMGKKVPVKLKLNKKGKKVDNKNN